MMSLLEGFSPFSYAAGIASAVAAVAANKAVNHFTKSKPVDDTDVKIQETFQKYMISEWHLPGLSSHYNKSTDKSPPKPIFAKPIQEQINVLKERMMKSVNTTSALPNIIVEGLPGVGKTMLIQQLCLDAGIGFVRLPSGAMESHLKAGSHITAFRGILDLAEKSSVPVCIIMDDGEELVATRVSTKGAAVDKTKAAWIKDKQSMSETIAQRRVALVNALLEEAGKEIRKIGIALTTNRPEVIDGAFRTRAHTLAIPLPELEERKQIIITHLNRIFKGDLHTLSFFDHGMLTKMARMTEGFTGRNIVKMLEDLYGVVQLENGNIRDEMVDAAIVAVKGIAVPPKAQPVKEKLIAAAYKILEAIKGIWEAFVAILQAIVSLPIDAFAKMREEAASSVSTVSSEE